MHKLGLFLIKNFKAILAILLGLLTIFKIGLRKPVTLEYPEKKSVLNDKFRGKLSLKYDKNKKLTCLGCETCIRVCPCQGVLTIKKEKNQQNKIEVKEFKIDLSKCIFCGNCVTSCPGNHIFMTNEYELANEEKSKLILTFKNKEEF